MVIKSKKKKIFKIGNKTKFGQCPEYFKYYATWNKFKTAIAAFNATAAYWGRGATSKTLHGAGKISKKSWLM